MQLAPGNWFAPPEGNRSRLFLGDENYQFVEDFPAGSGGSDSSFEGVFERNSLITETVARSLSTSRCSLVWVEQNA